jgi:hypothetical protein
VPSSTPTIGLSVGSPPTWLESTEIGASSRLGKLLLASTVTENGGDPGEQSALNLIELTAHSPSSHLKLLPGDDERLHVAGGNDQLVSGMLAELPAGALQHGYELAAATEGRIHFAGEHTATRYQGYLEGAVLSGERVARELHRRVGRR